MIDCYQEPVFQKWSSGIETYNKHCTINIPCFEISVKCTFIQLFYFYTKKLFYLKSLKALLSLSFSLSVSLSKIRKTLNFPQITIKTLPRFISFGTTAAGFLFYI